MAGGLGFPCRISGYQAGHDFLNFIFPVPYTGGSELNAVAPHGGLVSLPQRDSWRHRAYVVLKVLEPGVKFKVGILGC